jgi:hypothetical protein
MLENGNGIGLNNDHFYYRLNHDQNQVNTIIIVRIDTSNNCHFTQMINSYPHDLLLSP